MYLFQFSTCFEQPTAHHPENQFYQYNFWYMSLCVGDRWFSWWWARGCSKHVENWNKYIENNCASSWSFTKNHNRMDGQQNLKNCFSVYMGLVFLFFIVCWTSTLMWIKAYLLDCTSGVPDYSVHFYWCVCFDSLQIMCVSSRVVSCITEPSIWTRRGMLSTLELCKYCS
jgi:hypothetical protein